jgi:hypothetical protein
MTALVGRVVLWCCAASVAGAQVGYEPARSPYRDLEHPHEITFLSGNYFAKRDVARVAPRDGAMLGFRYQWLAAGPVNLMTEVSRVESERRVLDPELPGTCTGKPAADCRLVSMYRWPLYFLDAGIAVNFTGPRSYRRLVPEVRTSLGLVSDFHSSPDVGDFTFGTRLTFGFGAGIRWIPRNAYQVRLDLGTKAYTVNYPSTYFTPF